MCCPHLKYFSSTCSAVWGFLNILSHGGGLACSSAVAEHKEVSWLVSGSWLNVWFPIWWQSSLHINSLNYLWSTDEPFLIECHLHSFCSSLLVLWISDFSCSVTAFIRNDECLDSSLVCLHTCQPKKHMDPSSDPVQYIWLSALSGFAFTSSSGVWSSTGFDQQVEGTQSRMVWLLSLSCLRMSQLVHSWGSSCCPSNWATPSWLLFLLQGQSSASSSLSLPRDIHPGICMCKAIVICPA